MMNLESLTKLDLKKRLLVPLAVIVVAAVGSFLLIVTAPAVENVSLERTPLSVRVVEPRPSDVRLWVHSQGTVAPRTESELVPEVSGPVTWVSPALVSGGFFEVGEPLLRIDMRDYEAALAHARANRERADSENEHAAAELKRQKGLSRSNVASAAQLSQARRAARVAAATLEDARVSYDQAKRDLDRTEIVAPFSGRVREERVDVGQFVSRGAKIATLYATDFAEIRLPIADHQLAFIDLPTWTGEEADTQGPEVRLRARFAGREHEWTGTVVRTEGEIDAKSRMVHVVARVSDPYGDPEATGRSPLAVGLFVRADIEGPMAEAVIVIPRQAMRDGSHLLIVDGDNRLHTKEVEVLRIDRDQVLVRARFEPDDRIVVSPIQVVVEGMRVDPHADEGASHS